MYTKRAEFYVWKINQWKIIPPASYPKKLGKTPILDFHTRKKLNMCVSAFLFLSWGEARSNYQPKNTIWSKIHEMDFSGSFSKFYGTLKNGTKFFEKLQIYWCGIEIIIFADGTKKEKTGNFIKSHYFKSQKKTKLFHNQQNSSINHTCCNNLHTWER